MTHDRSSLPAPERTPNLLAYGFTYVELLIAITISAVLMAGLMGVVNTATKISDDVRQRNDLTRQARFAMQRLQRYISYSPHLLLPLNDNPNTDWPENIREQTIPPTPATGSSTLATAVLAVTLPAFVDLDDNGLPDADNDGDGRIDEDLGADNNNDGAAGILLIDDNGDGTADNSTQANPQNDNDEDNSANEEIRNNVDDDDDGSIDEDLASDQNRDGEDGIAGVDDDGDGAVDENNKNDDDEDGNVDEDGYDAVVFYLSGNQLIERTPVPWDNNSDSVVNGADFIESVITENVTRFRVERLVGVAGSTQLLDILLQLTNPVSSEEISLHTRVRLGAAL